MNDAPFVALADAGIAMGGLGRDAVLPIVKVVSWAGSQQEVFFGEMLFFKGNIKVLFQTITHGVNRLEVV